MSSTYFELVLVSGSIPHQYTAFIPDGEGGRLVEHNFEWRSDSTALHMDLGTLSRAAISGKPPEDDLHIRFGQRLYQAVFDGAVGDLWNEHRKAHRRKPLRLIVRIDPETARPLLNLPWEYLHDGKRFLSLDWHTPISRLPWGVELEDLPALTEPLRLLVMTAAPKGLPQNQVLHTAREEDLILAATAEARKAGLLQVEFTPNGSLQALENALWEYDPHMLHFTGHGVFIQAQDRGLLLMEDKQGKKRDVPNAEFADLLEQCAQSLRFVFLSACQSAQAARTEGFADLGPRLLDASIPAVVAMQFSVRNRSAMELGSVFYRGIADGKTVDTAMTEARVRMQRKSPNTVDFAVPVLFLNDPQCLQVDPQSIRKTVDIPRDMSGLTEAQNFVGRNAELRQLQTNLDPERGTWRAAVVHGLGGMGKTVLAARLAARMASRFDGVKTLRMAPTTTAQSVLDGIGSFLLVNNARFNLPRITEFNTHKDAQIPLETKAGQLADILKVLRLLLIFDNCEDILPEGKAVSFSSKGEPQVRKTGLSEVESHTSANPGVDPALLKLIAMLVGSVAGPSRFMFTSRVDFEPVERARLTGAIGHLDLGEMGFTEAVYLMETLPPLDELPVAVIEESRVQTGTEEESRGGGIKPLSKRDVYERLGGHPYAINLFAEHARRSSVGEVLGDLSGVKKELLEFTLMERAVEKLPRRAAVLLRRAAIFLEPVPMEGLAYLMGDEHDAMPEVDEELEALQGWGLIAQLPGTYVYVLHSLVKDWAQEQVKEEQHLWLLRRAANYWSGVGKDSSSLESMLAARQYLYLAGDYEKADDIVQFAFDYLLRWGQIEKLLGLLHASVNTLSGKSRAVALGNLATVFQRLGDYRTARRYNEQVLAEFQALDAQPEIATALHQLGNLHYLQGEYERARERYQQSLAIFEELNNRAGVASTLHQLGSLHYQQGEYERALERYEQSQEIMQEIGDRMGVATGLGQLGTLHQMQGEYEQARERYEQALEIMQEIGDRAGVASNLHGLGILHQRQGEYEQARERYQQSRAIKQEIGDRAGVARSLGQLGILHQDQGEYEQAQECYQQSLEIFEELGDRVGLASSLHQLGMLYQGQGEYERARERYEQSLGIAEELGDRAGEANSLGQLGMLHHDQGEYEHARELYEQALEIMEEIGDRVGVATSLHQLGIIRHLQGEHEPARERYEQALEISEELGDRSGVARRLGQLGRLEEDEGNYPRAVEYAAKSYALFDQLGSPDRDKAGRMLARLQEIMGEEAFKFAINAIDIPEENPKQQGITEDQILNAVVSNTVNIMTKMPEKKPDWWKELGQLQSQARSAELDDLASFLGLVRRLVEGTSQERLTPQVPEEYHKAWNEIIQGS